VMACAPPSLPRYPPCDRAALCCGERCEPPSLGSCACLVGQEVICVRARAGAEETCLHIGQRCLTGAECCSGACQDGFCHDCGRAGESCADIGRVSGECCSGTCAAKPDGPGGSCTCSPSTPVQSLNKGGLCSSSADCCLGIAMEPPACDQATSRCSLAPNL